MVIELKRVRVREELRERYLALDAEIWTAGLAGEEGFLGKEAWIDLEDRAELVLVVRWQSERHWQALPEERLQELEQAFARELPAGWQELETRAFEVAEAGALAGLLAGGLARTVP